ncbi:MAG: hypothetical protein HY362_03670 [Candidatus Aenigmarchaeota archaeon]|nr:hypothetical protein [Candidatus Aenigmarchaeota archaeon]
MAEYKTSTTLDEADIVLNSAGVKEILDVGKRGQIEVFTSEKDLGDLVADYRWGYVLWRDDDPMDKLKEILYPGELREALTKTQLKDVISLAAHMLYRRDIFVTTNRLILEKRRELSEKLGVRIMEPLEFLKFMNIEQGKTETEYSTGESKEEEFLKAMEGEGKA